MAQEDVAIGIIGMGAMGAMYAKRLSDAGWRVNACDREEKYAQLKEAYANRPNITIYPNGHLVSRISDWIIYSVEAEMIEQIVAKFGPSTKQGAIVGGQTSCKAPEIAALERHLPVDVSIVSCHSLHGPSVDPKGQPLVVIQHRAADTAVKLVADILTCFDSKIVYLTAEQHDVITADTQAVTHAAFLSMGTAWQANAQFPWEMGRYVGGIENVKINLMFRIYSAKWHVYAGLAILNPSAKKQIRQYAESVTSLYKLMLEGDADGLMKRVTTAGEAVFGHRPPELLLEDAMLDQFSFGDSKGKETKTPNSHLTLLAIVDCWWRLGISPYDHMICSTPLFRLWLGATEYLYRKPGLLDETLKTAIEDNTFRSDDLEFTFAARGWSDCVSFGDFAVYKDRFEKTASYFAPRFPEATRVGNEMIKTILQTTKTTS